MTSTTRCRRPIPILTYHQIAPLADNGTAFRDLTVTPALFTRHMQALARLGYRGLSMRDLGPYLNGDAPADKVVGLTFDDGYVNVFEHARPVLNELGFTATSYVVPGQTAGNNIWDFKHGIAASPLVNTDQMREWIRDGHEIGSHTMDHADLPTCSPEIARQQIRDSKTQLEDMLGTPINAFCYPYGRLNDSHVEMARQSGYHNATTTHPGRVRTGQDLMRLPRLMMYAWTSPVRLALQVLTPIEDLRGWRRHRRSTV